MIGRVFRKLTLVMFLNSLRGYLEVGDTHEAWIIVGEIIEGVFDKDSFESNEIEMIKEACIEIVQMDDAMNRIIDLREYVMRDVSVPWHPIWEMKFYSDVCDVN